MVFSPKRTAGISLLASAVATSSMPIVTAMGERLSEIKAISEHRTAQLKGPEELATRGARLWREHTTSRPTNAAFESLDSRESNRYMMAPRGRWVDGQV